MNNSKSLKLNKFFALLLSMLFVFCMLSAVSAAKIEGDVNCPDYSFTALDGTSVDKTSAEGKTTLMLFVKAQCSNCQQMVREIASANWINFRQLAVRVVFIEGEDQSAIQGFVDAYGEGNSNIIYCSGANSDATAFLSAAGMPTAGGFNTPVTVLVGTDGKLKNVSQDRIKEADIKSMLLENDATTVLSPAVDISVTGSYGYDEAFELLELINAERAAKGKAAFKMTDLMLSGAMQRAAERLVCPTLAGQRPDGTSPETVIEGNYKISERLFGKMSSGNIVGQLGSEIQNDEYNTVGIGVFTQGEVKSWAILFSKDCGTGEASKEDSAQKTATIAINEDICSLLVNVQPNGLVKGENGSVEALIKTPGSMAGVVLDSSCLSYESDNPDVVTVSSLGKLTAVSAGNAVISVKIKNSGVSGETALTVTLPNPDGSGNTSSKENTSSEETTSGETSSGETTSNGTTSGDTTSNEISSEETTSGDTTSQGTASGDGNSVDGTFPGTSSEITSAEQNTSSKPTTSEETASGDENTTNTSSNTTVSGITASGKPSIGTASKPVNTASGKPSGETSETASGSENTTSENASSADNTSSTTENTSSDVSAMAPDDGNKPTDDKPSNGNQDKTVLIILIVLGALLLAAGGVVLYLYLKKKKSYIAIETEEYPNEEGFILTQDEESEN